MDRRIETAVVVFVSAILFAVGMGWHIGATPPESLVFDESNPRVGIGDPNSPEVLDIETDGNVSLACPNPDHPLKISGTMRVGENALDRSKGMDTCENRYYENEEGRLVHINEALLIAKAPPEATVPVVTSQVPTAAMDINRLLIVLDLIKDGNVSTPANYASSKLDYMNAATALQYTDPFLRVWCKWSQEQVDAANNEQKALAVLDRLKWFFKFAYRSEQADMKETQAAAVETADKQSTTDLGEDEYQPPTADPGGTYTGTAGSPVSFDGSGSSDPDGTIASYAWDFGDTGTGTGATPSHTYAAEGSYTVTLTVTDDRDLTHSAETTATISAAP